MNKDEIKKGMKMARMVGDALADAKFATKDEVDALSDTYVTFSAMSSALSTITGGGGGNYDSDIAVINSTLSSLSAKITENTETIASCSIAYIGTSCPADFHGIFFDTSGY